MRVIEVSVRPAKGASARSGLATVEIMAGVTLAHTWAGGSLPALPWLVGLAALVFLASLRVVTGRAPMGRMVLGLAVAQLALHLLLAALAPAAGGGPQGHHGHAAATATGGWELSWQMVAAHAISAVVTACVWRARRRLMDVVVSWPTLAAAQPAAPRLLASGGSAASLQTRWFLLATPRRGPPWAVVPHPT